MYRITSKIMEGCYNIDEIEKKVCAETIYSLF